MAEESDLILALEFITEGARALVPQQLQREAFALESFQKEMEKIRKKSRGWTMGRSIQGLGVGRKITKGREEETLAIRVYVDRKKARAKCKNPVPKTMSVPEAGRIYLGIGRDSSYQAAARGEIPVIRVGRLLRVPVVGMERLLDRAAEDLDGEAA